MSKPLNQPELEREIDDILYGEHPQPYSKGDALFLLIQREKQAAVDAAHEEWHGNTGL